MSKGLDFSKIKSFSVDGGIVYKDSYYNPGTKKYKKSVTRQNVTSNQRELIAECIREQIEDYDIVCSRLENMGMEIVKESYWDMARRVFSYLDVNDKFQRTGWILVPKDIKSYKEGFNYTKNGDSSYDKWN